MSQRTAINEIREVKVLRGGYPGGDLVTIEYLRRGDAWHVRTPGNDRFHEFASAEASDRTVRQLINKKWCSRYSENPDDF